MITIYLIRHSKTKGNLSGKYIGTTDESLCEEGIRLLKNKKYNFGNIEAVYSSPMIRCRETAKILFRDKDAVIYDDLRECDFGDFENKNYKELDGNEDYQKWIDSNGKIPFPNGEDHKDFKDRCFKAFQEVIKDSEVNGYKNIAIVAHGGTIMSILERVNNEGKSFYDYRVKNASGYILKIENSRVEIKESF